MGRGGQEKRYVTGIRRVSPPPKLSILYFKDFDVFLRSRSVGKGKQKPRTAGSRDWLEWKSRYPREPIRGHFLLVVMSYESLVVMTSAPAPRVSLIFLVPLSFILRSSSFINSSSLTFHFFSFSVFRSSFLVSYLSLLPFLPFSFLYFSSSSSFLLFHKPTSSVFRFLSSVLPFLLIPSITSPSPALSSLLTVLLHLPFSSIIASTSSISCFLRLSFSLSVPSCAHSEVS